MDNDTDPYALLDGVRLWQWIIVFLGAIDGAAFILTPGLTDSGAYSWARQFLPGWGWGTLFACSSLLGLFALVSEGRGLRWPVLVSKLSLTIYGLAAGSIGLSIAVLTFQGSTGAITGASKWWLPFFLSARILSGETMLKAPLEVVEIVPDIDPSIARYLEEQRSQRENEPGP